MCSCNFRVWWIYHSLFTHPVDEQAWLRWTALPRTFLHLVDTLVSKRCYIQEWKRWVTGYMYIINFTHNTKLFSRAAFPHVSLAWCSVRDGCKTLDHIYYFKLWMFKVNLLPPPISGRHQVNKLPKRISELVCGLGDPKSSQVLSSLERTQTWYWPFTS